MDANQFADTLKDVELSQKVMKPEYFYEKIVEDLLDFLKKFKEVFEVNNWSNRWKVKLIRNYLKGNMKF